jgi:hypothetical protein
MGDYSRGGKTRGDNPAADHDMGCEEKHAPFGVVNEDTGHLHLSFGSSAKTRDFIVDSLYGGGQSIVGGTGSRHTPPDQGLPHSECIANKSA